MLGCSYARLPFCDTHVHPPGATFKRSVVALVLIDVSAAGESKAQEGSKNDYVGSGGFGGEV